MMNAMRVGIAGLLICALLGTGCFGSFALTRGTHSFNRTVSPNRWIEWGLFVGMIVAPVYEVALLVDAVVMNSAEFWTGTNPFVTPPPPQKSENDPREAPALAEGPAASR